MFVQSEVAPGVDLVQDGLSMAESQGPDSKLVRNVDIMWMGTDLEREYNLQEQWQLDHPPTYMFHDKRDSRVGPRFHYSQTPSMHTPLPPPPPPGVLPDLRVASSLTIAWHFAGYRGVCGFHLPAQDRCHQVLCVHLNWIFH